MATATLYDIRAYSTRHNWRTTDPRGVYVATTKAVMGALRDHPDMVAIRNALPKPWHKAFDRAGSFWFDKYDDNKPGRMTLRALNGSTIATLYAYRSAR